MPIPGGHAGGEAVGLIAKAALEGGLRDAERAVARDAERGAARAVERETVQAVERTGVDTAEREAERATESVAQRLAGDGITAPGPHAGESIPARGPGRDWTAAERREIDRIGQDTGCHRCGATDPGTKAGHHVPDHQPPSQLNPHARPQHLYPHCIDCSRKQGGIIAGMTKKIGLR